MHRTEPINASMPSISEGAKPTSQQKYFFASVALQVKIVDGVEAAVHSLAVPRNPTLVENPLLARLHHPLLHIPRHVALEIVSIVRICRRVATRTARRFRLIIDWRVLGLLWRLNVLGQNVNGRTLLILAVVWAESLIALKFLIWQLTEKLKNRWGTDTKEKSTLVAFQQCNHRKVEIGT